MNPPDGSCTKFRHVGIGRRDFFRIGGVGLFGLTLPAFYGARGQAAESKGKVAEAKADHMILIWLGGGPPHQDMFDMKPEAPEEVRGEFKPIKTNVEGIEVCELMPRLAKLADKYTILRSCGIGNEKWEHGGGLYWLTGNPRRAQGTPRWPMYGNTVSKLRPAAGGLPSFVTFDGIPGGGNLKQQLLGPEYDPMVMSIRGKDDETIGTLVPPPGLDVESFNRREQLRRKLDQQLRRQDELDPLISALDQYQQTGFDLLRSPKLRVALDLEKEDPEVAKRYGTNNHAKKVLAARRLVEAGVPFVSFQFEGNWDHHGNNFNSCRSKLPNLDNAVASLLEDLAERGMLQRTIVAVLGEMGRTPKVNKGSGRDHWGKIQSILVAGGGFKGGKVVGSTDEHAAYVKDNPYRVESFGRTIYQLLGIDPDQRFAAGAGQPMSLIAEPAPLIKEALV